jgi:hypothetical protein
MFDFFISILIARLIQNIKKKLKYMLKIHYVINYIMFDFLYFQNILNNMNHQSSYQKVKRQTFRDERSTSSILFFY